MKTPSTLSKILLAIISCPLIAISAVFTFGILLAPFVPDDDDFLYEIAKECIETKISKGYTEEFAREYCFGAGEGCTEKVYAENCEVDFKCCFATIEEDKKWNYLDYDENGNKIEK